MDAEAVAGGWGRALPIDAGRPAVVLPAATLIRLAVYWLGIAALWAGLSSILAGRLQ
jgi:hypothetical protein